MNLDTEEFVEYSSGAVVGDLSFERHGENFFEASRADAQRILHESDRERFCNAFTKEKVVSAIDAHGAFTIMYLQLVDEKPRNMSMKVVRMAPGDNHIIIGVSDVHAYMAREKRFREAELERAAYARIIALSDEFLCIYDVDPETEYYLEYDATVDYASLGFPREGRDFFAVAREHAEKMVHPDDVPAIVAKLTKANVTEAIHTHGRFVLRYRLIIGDNVVPVKCVAALAEKSEGQKLVIGITRA